MRYRFYQYRAFSICRKELGNKFRDRITFNNLRKFYKKIF